MAEARARNLGWKVSEMRLKQRGKVALKQISMRMRGISIVTKLVAKLYPKVSELHKNAIPTKLPFLFTLSAQTPIRIPLTAVITV